MSRLGTCRWAHQIQEMWRIPTQPHQRVEHIVMPEGEYTCQWLDGLVPLPPPLARRHGGIDIQADDCNACKRYESVTVPSIK